MNPRIKKEIRTLLPAFAVSALGPFVVILLFPFCGWSTMFSWGLIIAIMGAVAMGAFTFGDEYNHRTIGLLLSQPFSRGKIWREKMMVFGLAMMACAALVSGWFCIVFNNPYWMHDEESGGILTAIFFAVGIFCTIPFWTLLIKSAIGGVMMSAIFPAAIGLTVFPLVEKFPQLKAPPRYGGDGLLLMFALGLYFVICLWQSRRIFVRYELIETQRPEFGLPEKVEKVFLRPWKHVLPGYSGVWSSLINKELNLQRGSFTLALTFAILFVIESVVWKLSVSENALAIATGFLIATFAIYLMVIPLFVGGVSIAEERNWGVMNWQLMLSPSRSKQWWMKISTTMLISAVLGIVVPLLVFESCKAFCHFPYDPFKQLQTPLNDGRSGPFDNLNCFFIYLLLSSLAIFASSLSANTMRAVILTLLLLFICGAMIAINTSAFDSINLFAIPARIHVESPMLLVRSLIGATTIGLTGVLLLLSYSNYVLGEVTPRRRWLHPLLLLITIDCSFVLLFLIVVLIH